MSHKHIFTALAIALSLITDAFAGPVTRPSARYTQPDGHTFAVTITGDEWTKVRKTEDGCAIIKDDQGWWCYGSYDDDGCLQNTGYRVGSDVPDAVRSACRQIPYKILSQKAEKRRSHISRYSAGYLEAVRRNIIRTKTSGETVQKRALAILVEFNDVQFKYSRDDFYRLLNEKGYNGTGSAKDYYEDQFGDGWEFTFDVSEIITLSWPVKHYGENDSEGQDIRPWNMVKEACIEAGKQGIRFSDYDQDGDDVVDNVYIFYAGKSEAENTDQTELIWPHKYYIYSGEPQIDLVIDGKRIDGYACSAEITGTRSLTGIGSFCHEYGHTFGLADLYDTNYDEDGGWAAGTWSSTSLMDGGNYNNHSATPPNFNCIEREMLGLSEPVLLQEGQTYRIEPIHKSGQICRLDSGTEGEYYLFECRSNEGWDKYIGGSGMLVYHIDKVAGTMINGKLYSTWVMNTVNAEQAHQCADLLEADGRSDLISGYSDLDKGIQGIFFPQSNVTAITSHSTPAFTYWYGAYQDISVAGIRKDGDDVVFNVIKGGEVTDIPGVFNPSFTAFPDAVIITFEKTDPTLEGVPSLEWRKSGSNDDYKAETPVEYTPGKYACKITGLECGNISYETQIRFSSGGYLGRSYRLSFMTKSEPPVDWPYIYISSGTIKTGNTIGLHIVNAADAAVTEWSYNGKEIGDDMGGVMFKPETNGTLKAVLTMNNGEQEIIVKELKVTE